MKIYRFHPEYRMLVGMRETEEENPLLATNETLKPPGEYTPKCYKYYTRTEGNNWHYDWIRKPCISYQVDDFMTYEIEQFGRIVPDCFNEDDIEILRKKVKQDIYFACEIEMKEKNRPVFSKTLNRFINCKESEISHLKGIDRLVLNRELMGIADGVDPPYGGKPLPFRLFDGSYLMVTVSQLKSIRAEIMDEMIRIKCHKFMLYSLIEKSNTKEDLKAVKWIWPVI